MSKASYWQRGEAIDFVNETEEIIEANQIIVFGEHIGIAGTTFGPGETGTLHVFGVFEMPKAEGEEIAAGTPVYYDTEGEAVTSESGGSTIEIGYATEAADAEHETVKVKLLG